MYPEITGFETKEATLYTEGGIVPGMTVALKENCTAVKAASGEKFCGVCTDVRGRYITVALKGYAEASYSGTAPVVGYNTLAGDGNGNAAVKDGGREILVAAVDTQNKKISIIL